MADSVENIEDGLLSNSPSARLRAATQIKASRMDVDIRVIMRALQGESVPQIRQVLNDVLAARSGRVLDGDPARAAERSEHVPELARLIRHELSPPIGWIHKAGAREIDDYARSATNDAVNRLERRMDALVALIRKDSALVLEECTLAEFLEHCWPSTSTRVKFTAPAEGIETEFRLLTDAGLLEIILANAFQNAIDASLEVAGDETVEVSWGFVGERFWVRVSNAFSGRQFDIKDVGATGISTKSGHQGIGISLIKTATERLGYGFRVAGRSGLATFTLTGGRSNGTADRGGS